MKKISKAHKDMKWKEAIALLNDIVRIKLAPSLLHGIGVFAIRDMKKGEKLYADVIPNAFDLPYKKLVLLKPEIREIILSHWPNVLNGSHFLYPVTKMTAFINHLEIGNYDINKDELLADVKKGDEITMNYKRYNNWAKLFPWLKS